MVQTDNIKICIRCSKPRTSNNFEVIQRYVSKKTGNIIPYSRNVCKTCRKAAWLKIYRRVHLDNEYGLTEYRYTKMLIEQGGCCKICGKPMMKPQIDHDHKTGKIRALLCAKCNSGLHFIENKEFLVAAEIYLWQHNEEMSEISDEDIRWQKLK